MKAYSGFFIDKLNKEVYWIQVFAANESTYNMLSDMTNKWFQHTFLWFWKDIFLHKQTFQTPNKNSTLREIISNKSRLVVAT